MQRIAATASGPRGTASSERALSSVAADLTPELDDIAIGIAQTLHREIPELGEHPEFLEDSRANARAHLDLVVAMLRDGLDAAGAEPPAEALHHTREYVHRGLPLSALLRTYRVGHADFWQRWLVKLRERIDDPALLAEAVRRSSDFMFAYVDKVSGRLTVEYAAEQARWIRSAAAVRADTVRSILDGTLSDQLAGQHLGYALERNHLAFVVWADTDDVDVRTVDSLEQIGIRVAVAAGCPSPLLVPLGRLLLAGWLGSHADIAPEKLDSVAIDAGASGARLAAGDPGEGIQGFRQSHREAMLARRIVTLTSRPPGTATHYRAVSLAALASADLDQARRFVARELGLLGKEDDTTVRLAATLRVFLEEGRSLVRAARRVGIHANTVAYRVRRAEELLGRDVRERPLELHVALTLALDRIVQGSDSYQPHHPGSFASRAVSDGPSESSSKR